MKYFFFMVIITLFISTVSFAQKDTVVVKDYYTTGNEGTLNDAINAAIQAGTISNTVFKLEPYGTYVLNSSIDLSNAPGATLEIDADPAGNTQETAPPMICWSSSSSFSKTYIMDIAGKLILKNIWILWADLSGTRVTSTIRVGDSVSTSGGRIEADNVIFDYVQQSSSGAIQPYSTNFVGHFTNCYFRNCTDDHFRYYSRAVSVPYTSSSSYGGLHADTCTFDNCTFANIGYVYMQEKDYYTNYLSFNHCTFYNVVMYPLEGNDNGGGPWWKMDVTNSLFINTWMFGYIPGSANNGSGSGTVSISPIDTTIFGVDTVAGFGYSVPFTESDRRVLFANNDYYIQPWLVDWMGWDPATQTLNPNASPYSKDQYQNRHSFNIPLPQQMFDKITRMYFDSTNSDGSKAYPYFNAANLDSLAPGFVNPPINLDSLKTFLTYKWGTNADIPWSWNIGQYLNGSGGQVWPLSESLAYTNDTLKTAAMGGFPLGDLYHWWPAQYTQWKAQETTEQNRISTWLNSGKDPGTLAVEKSSGNIPASYSLSQNYPNPFNPTTEIKYSIAKAGYVTLKVYNVIGQEVATLFQGQQNAGLHDVSFNGASLSSGVYFYRLQAGSVSITKKLILMK